MRLTLFTDYSLRVLMYVGVKDGAATISELAESYGVSRNHLMKVIQRLAQLGYLETARGRRGGLRLARPPGEISVGEVVRRMEDDLALVNCFDPAAQPCVIAQGCVLRRALGEALEAFLAVLDGYTLEDLIAPRRRLARLLGLDDAVERRAWPASTDPTP